MPKRGESIPARRHTGPRKRRLSRAEREARTQRYIIAALGIVVGVSVILLVAAVVYEQLIFPNQPIIVIGNRVVPDRSPVVINAWVVTTRDFQGYVRLARLQTIYQLAPIVSQFGMDALRDPNLPFYNQYMQLSNPISMGQQVIDQLIEQEMVRREAEERGITVTDEEVEDRMWEFFGYNRHPEETEEPETPTPTYTPSVTPTPRLTFTPSPVPSETPTPEASPIPTSTPTETLAPTATPLMPTLEAMFQEDFNAYLQEAVRYTGLSEEQIRRVFRDMVLRERVREAITGEVPTVAEQVHARHILVTDEDEALAIMRAITEDGENFSDFARFASEDYQSAGNGGDLGWFPRGQMVEEFEEAAFNAEVGEIVGPVRTQYGYHIIQVLGHEMERELTEEQIAVRREQAYNDWLDARRESSDVKVYDYWVDRVPEDPTIEDVLGLGT